MNVPCPFCAKLTAVDALPADELVWQFPHSVVLLGPWQFFHGYCLLVARAHVTELHHLPDDTRHAYLDEQCRLARAIETAFQPRKLNCEWLGNQVAHLHGHLFPRYQSDPNHLQPVWLDLARAESDPAERQRLQTGPTPRAETVAALRRALAATA